MRRDKEQQLNLHQVWSETVNDGTECKTVAPRRCPVGQFNALVAVSHLNTPVQQFFW